MEPECTELDKCISCLVIVERYCEFTALQGVTVLI